jgi:uncharacterized protein
MTDRSGGACFIDTRRSPHVRLRPIPLTHLHLTDPFWTPRRETNGRYTLRLQLHHLETSRALDNFRRVADGLDAPFTGMYFADSDVYKWLEAVGWHLADHPDGELQTQAEAVIDLVERTQRPDGYLNSYFALERADERWSDFDLHEMYCAGHLFQGAVAYHRTTGDRRILKVATRLADHLCVTFSPGPTQRVAVDGHQEVELGLIELYRTTGERRYLDQAAFFVRERGRGLLGRPYGHRPPEYSQDHAPFESMDEVVGHAVRALYYTAAVADLCAEIDAPHYRAALERQWHNMTQRRMYVNGGVGARYEGESFGDDYELPHARAYTETCAAIASVMWNSRMLAFEGEARFADLVEWTLFNAVLPGLSLDGERYFYQNPLADDGHHRRQEWFGVACCPPNVARTLAALPGYLYGVADDELWVHLYAGSRLRTRLPSGAQVALTQTTRYPWADTVEFRIDEDTTFALMLRVPQWCHGATLELAGVLLARDVTPGTYLRIARAWRAGDTAVLRLPMPVRYLAAHRHVGEATGRAAIARGPVLYCVEAVDHPGIDPRDLALPTPDAFDVVPSGLPGGLPALRAASSALNPDQGALYRDVDVDPSNPREPAELTAIPYFAWANRQAGAMQVWLHRPTTLLTATEQVHA